MEIKHINLVKNIDLRRRIKECLQDFYDLFAENRLQNGMIYSFLINCIDGEILTKTGNKPKHYINKFSDFYIDDRVGFKGLRRLYKSQTYMKELLNQV